MDLMHLTFGYTLNNHQSIANMMPDTNSGRPLQYSTPLNGNEQGVRFPPFPSALRPNDLHSSTNYGGNNTSTNQALGCIVENNTPAHTSQPQLTVPESPLDLRKCRELKSDIPSKISTSTKESENLTKRPKRTYTRRKTTIPKVTKCPPKKKWKEGQESVTKMVQKE